VDTQHQCLELLSQNSQTDETHVQMVLVQNTEKSLYLYNLSCIETNKN
jgi:hypothetical protein